MDFAQLVQEQLLGLARTVTARRCPDQYVGSVDDMKVHPAFGERRPAAARPNGIRCVLLVLESPHVREFEGDPGPAKGPTGVNIARYLPGMIDGSSGMGVILMNAVQYQCSLGLPTDLMRDRVFTAVWRKGGDEDFCMRLAAVYREGDVLLNCCTAGKRETAPDELRRLVLESMQATVANATVTGRTHPSFWHFRRNRELLWHQG